MKISEISFVVQGEGENCGEPSILIRLAGCNKIPPCSFCDTKYALVEGQEMSIIDVIKEVKKYNCRHIMFSGGEPLAQQDELIKLMNQLLNQNMFYYFNIETNGTIQPKQRLMELTDLFTVSPKFENFKYSKIFSELNNYVERAKVVFKFVIDKPEDINDVLHFNNKYNLVGRTVYLMPCATTREEIYQKLPMLIEMAKEHHFKVTTRLHIEAYGNKRGV